MGLGQRSRHGDEQPEYGSGHVPGNQVRWLFRMVRGLRPDRNPLRRRIDRLEACLLAGLFAAAAAGAPFAARAAGNACRAGALQARQEQLATRHQVRAVLTQPAVPVNGYAIGDSVLAQATWTSADGMHRSGEVAARQGSGEGTAVTVWTDGDGYLVSPPLTVSQAADQADTAAVGAVIGVAVVCVAGSGAIRRLLNRRRMAAWEADWLATAPTWNRQSW